jgi:hydrogenase/urease accessory protein HupE
MRRLVLLAIALLCVVLFVGRADAHGMRSAYVEIVEQAPGRAYVTVRAQVPVTGVRLFAEAPCSLADASDGTPGVQLLACPDTVAAARMRIDGLGPIVSEAVVWTVLADGASTSTLVTPARPSWSLPSARTSWPSVARQYVALGVEHILTGGDHLLFLLGLVVVLRRVRAVLLAETAFTLSHTLTFSASALGWVRVSAPAVEACIALSLVLVALEAKRTAPAHVWQGAGLAFVFGLVHGLGFAGGLAEIGLPDRAIPAALAGFAGGVEIGQVAFLAAVLALFALARRARKLERGLSLAATYAVGCIGCFWLLERLRALLFAVT